MRSRSHAAAASQDMFPDEGSVPTDHADTIATSRRSCRNIAVNPILFLEDDTMEVAEQFTAQRQAKNYDAKNYDAMILLGYAIFAIVFLATIYFDSMSSGTTPGDFVSMIVFP
jgi:hypothetical protein